MREGLSRDSGSHLDLPGRYGIHGKEVHSSVDQ
jgi:hypothetical protein